MSIRNPLDPYYTVVVPYVPTRFQTEWHARDSDPPGLRTLTRGSFGTQEEAIIWGRDHLNGMPYEVRLIPAFDPNGND